MRYFFLFCSLEWIYLSVHHTRADFNSMNKHDKIHVIVLIVVVKINYLVHNYKKATHDILRFTRVLQLYRIDAVGFDAASLDSRPLRVVITITVVAVTIVVILVRRGNSVCLNTRTL